MMKKEERRWMIDRRIPVAVILTIFIQIGGMLVWATSLDARVSRVEQQASGVSGASEKLARIEERLNYMKQDTESIKHQLNFLTDRLIKE